MTPGAIYSLICICQPYRAKRDISIATVDIQHQKSILDFGAIRRVAFVAPFVSRSIMLLCGFSSKLRASCKVWRISERSVSDLPIPISSANIPPRHFDVILDCLICVILCLNLWTFLESPCKGLIGEPTYNTRRPIYSGTHMEYSSLRELPRSRFNMNCRAASW